MGEYLNLILDKIPHSVQVGEIIAHRVWCVRADTLMSTWWFRHEWEKGVCVARNLDNDIDVNVNLNLFNRNLGIFAWKEEEEAKKYIADLYGPQLNLCVLGTVYLYGEVWVHRNGYRATHASIRSLDKLYRWEMLPKNIGLNPIYNLRELFKRDVEEYEPDNELLVKLRKKYLDI